jgi:hypothetical protein
MTDALMLALHRIVMVVHGRMGLVFPGVANSREGIGPEQDRENHNGGQQRPQRNRWNLTMPNHEFHSNNLAYEARKSLTAI